MSRRPPRTTRTDTPFPYTTLLRALFPLANKSYRSMSRMKALQPEMMKIRERFADDRQKMNMEMMALYKREKVNPASGCLPIVVQIPIFFALYKVLFVTRSEEHTSALQSLMRISYAGFCLTKK